MVYYECFSKIIGNRGRRQAGNKISREFINKHLSFIYFQFKYACFFSQIKKSNLLIFYSESSKAGLNNFPLFKFGEISF